MKVSKKSERQSSQNSNDNSKKKLQVQDKKEQRKTQSKNKLCKNDVQKLNYQNPEINAGQENKQFSQNQKIRQKLNELDLQKIFQMNKEYFMQKVSINEIPKPASYSFKMPSRIGSSEYSKQFHKNVKKFNTGHIERHDNLNNSKVDVTGYRTTYKTNFQSEKPKEKIDKSNQVKKDIKQLLKKKEQKTFVAQEKPSFMQTSYAFNYGSKRAIPAQSAKRKQCSLMGGGSFKGQTSYHNNFKGLNSKQQKPIRHTNNKLFMSLITPKQSTYSKQFNKNQKNQRHKTIQVVQSCKPKHQSVSKGRNIRVNTEYENSYNQTFLNTKVNSTKNSSCLNAEQLKQFILNL